MNQNDPFQNLFQKQAPQDQRVVIPQSIYPFQDEQPSKPETALNRINECIKKLFLLLSLIILVATVFIMMRPLFKALIEFSQLAWTWADKIY